MSTGIKSVPVLCGDALVGMVSRRDLMRALAHSDARIRDDVIAAIESFFPGAAGWDVSVEDGDVRLRQGTGGPTDKVAEVIAQTVPGVSRVTVVPN